MYQENIDETVKVQWLESMSLVTSYIHLAQQERLKVFKEM